MVLQVRSTDEATAAMRCSALPRAETIGSGPRPGRCALALRARWNKTEEWSDAERLQ